MNITINIIEAAAEIAERNIELKYPHTKIYKDENAEVLIYIDWVQEEFNQEYDKIYSMIESAKENKSNQLKLIQWHRRNQPKQK